MRNDPSYRSDCVLRCRYSPWDWRWVRRSVMGTPTISRASIAPRIVPLNIAHTATVRKNGRHPLGRPNFSLAAERTALIRSLKSAETNWFAMCSDFRDAGVHWQNIKAECRDRKISAQKWAAENAPLSKRWLDKYAELADRWDEFRASWKWSQGVPYAPERRPGLWGCFDLMDAKKRFDTYSESRKRGSRTDTGMGTIVPSPLAERLSNKRGNPIRLTATATLLHGDVTDMMAEHIKDHSMDLAIADVPYFFRTSPQTTAADRYIEQSGMKPMFDEAWDRFDSIEAYEAFCTAWIDEALRCLNDEGSLFIFGTYHNIGLINRICQMQGHVIINEIIWIQRNGRPNVATRRLQASHQNILWVVKDDKRYRFNYRLCKRNEYDDWLSRRNQQLRDVWDIPANGHENTSRHPSPKPLAVMERILDVAGKPSGLLLDLFSGSGTGAVAALTWGMRSVSIEREFAYVQMIRDRVAAEVRRG
jgi:site-specific DNA-methyltransferase (adenine-specific)